MSWEVWDLDPRDENYSLTRIIRLDGKTNPNTVTFSNHRIVHPKRKLSNVNRQFIYTMDGKEVDRAVILEFLNIGARRLSERFIQGDGSFVLKGHSFDRTKVMYSSWYLDGCQVSRAKLADFMGVAMSTMYKIFSKRGDKFEHNGKIIERRLD